MIKTDFQRTLPVTTDILIKNKIRSKGESRARLLGGGGVPELLGGASSTEAAQYLYFSYLNFNRLQYSIFINKNQYIIALWEVE